MIYLNDMKEVFVHYCWPGFFFPATRKKFKKDMFKIPVQQRLSDMNSGRGRMKGNKIDPWAFIRVKDERTTLLASLNSILPIIKKGVIAYNDCTDGSDGIIKEFCRLNPGFIPFNYPFYVEPAGSKKYATGELEEKNTLAAYYNAALEYIPKNEWLIKIDADQVYFPEILEHSFYLPQNEMDLVSYSRLNVIRDSHNELWVEKYIRPGDQWLVFNDNIHFVNVFGKDACDRFYACEFAKWGKKNRHYKPECSSIHFPYEKSYRKFKGNIAELMSLREFLKSASVEEFSSNLIDVYELTKEFD